MVDHLSAAPGGSFFVLDLYATPEDLAGFRPTYNVQHRYQSSGSSDVVLSPGFEMTLHEGAAAEVEFPSSDTLCFEMFGIGEIHAFFALDSTTLEDGTRVEDDIGPVLVAG